MLYPVPILFCYLWVMKQGIRKSAGKKLEKSAIFSPQKSVIFAEKCEKVWFLPKSAKNCDSPKVQKMFFFNENDEECDFYWFLLKQFRSAIFEAFLYIVQTCDWITLQPIRNINSILSSSQTQCCFYEECLMSLIPTQKSTNFSKTLCSL